MKETTGDKLSKPCRHECQLGRRMAQLAIRSASLLRRQSCTKAAIQRSSHEFLGTAGGFGCENV